ncbi:hypothetical protein LTR04_002576, partial [Oleoguttula sp. CCFEE 6159]
MGVGVPAGGPNGGGPRANVPDSHKQLHHYIYDYFLKNHQYELARAVHQEMLANTGSVTKLSPSRRDTNGMDDAMDTDSKNDLHRRPDDLPPAAIPNDSADGSFLFDWWCQFWDCWGAHRGKAKPGDPASQYLGRVQ